jgi:indole-3-glycerol phosphate synthase/phosphoribosylanthranilate isomerase
VVQLHGDEPPKDVKTLRNMLPKTCQIWKAYGVSESLPEFEKYNVDKHLLDTRIGNQTGGTGKVFDWSLLANSSIDKNNIILAGGLTPENAREAALIGVSGLDFNSGLESAPGKKDPELITKAFLEIKKYMLRD